MKARAREVTRVFLLKSTNPSSLLKFSNKVLHYFDVTIATTSISASRTVSTYDYRSTDGFVEFFELLASQEKPWSDIKSWQPLEAGMSMKATCDSLGHVAIKVILGESYTTEDRWSLECTLYFDFGMLTKFAKDAKNFYMH